MAAIASCCLPDISAWIIGLPPTTQWKTDVQSIKICSSKSNKISLKFSIKRNPNSDPFVVFSLLADFQYPVYLWSSNSCRVDNSTNSMSKDTMKDLFFSFIKQVLQYGPKKNSFLVLPSYLSTAHEQKYFSQMLNHAFASVLLCVCVYEAPSEIRSNCIQTVQKHLSSSKKSRESLKLLLQLMGSNLEEQWMRSIHLALTNTVGSDQAWLRLDQARRFLKGNDPNSPYQPFSYSTSSATGAGLWKIQLYSPIVATRLQNSSNRNIDDERLLFSLKHQHLEAVFQLSYSVNYKNQNWIEIIVAIDNVRCDIVPLVSDYLMAEKGLGVQDKHFPSRISLQLNPILQNHVLSVSLSKSSDNPTIEVGTEKNIEGGFDAPGTYFGLKVSTADTISMSVKPWKFEQTVDGDTGNLSWVLYEINDLKEISSSRPSKISILNPRAWFKDRYSTACRAFTTQGGVVFARDEYGDCISWKVKREAMGTTMDWEVKGSVWFTYLPNKHNTFYSETRSVEFTEVLQLPL